MNNIKEYIKNNKTNIITTVIVFTVFFIINNIQFVFTHGVAPDVIFLEQIIIKQEYGKYHWEDLAYH